MRIVECAREQDVLDALAAGRWPARCENALRTHVNGCGVCGDLVEAVGAILEERDAHCGDVRVPSAGTVWWRAQLRARQEAAQLAARPITAAQVAGGVAAVAALVVLGALLEPSAAAWAPQVAELFALELPRVSLPEVTRYDSLWWMLVLASGGWLVLAPVAIYLALTDE